jgi:hypothetical protein
MAGCTTPLFAMLGIEELLSTSWRCLAGLSLIGLQQVRWRCRSSSKRQTHEDHSREELQKHIYPLLMILAPLIQYAPLI